MCGFSCLRAAARSPNNVGRCPANAVGSDNRVALILVQANRGPALAISGRTRSLGRHLAIDRASPSAMPQRVVQGLQFGSAAATREDELDSDRGLDLARTAGFLDGNAVTSLRKQEVEASTMYAIYGKRSS